MRFAAFLVALSMLVIPGIAPAQNADQASRRSADNASGTGGAFADGEVRKVDKDAKKLTIRHGPLPALEMPAMTMVYGVRDVRILDSVKSGDRIRFEAEKAGGQYFVVRIEPVK